MTTSENTITSVATALRGRRVVAPAVGVAVFAALTAAGAKLAVPLPGTAVPFTLQVVAVLLAGISLGARRGMLSQLVYLAAGAAGLPVFAAGGGLAYLLGPTGGYLLAFPIGAAIAGGVADRWSGMLPMTAGAIAALACIHAAGAAWLSLLGAGSLALESVWSFLPGDVLKVALAVLVGGRLRGRLRGGRD